MVKINKIYTRHGDDGYTHLVGGSRVPKDSKRVEAYGDLDELNSFIGLGQTLAELQNNVAISAKLKLIQNELFDIGSELATPAGQEWEGMLHVTQTQITRLENWIDELTKDLPELRSFVLPGGTILNSYLHICRSVCRRTERRILKLARKEDVPKLIRIYLNRLSDLFFAMARFESLFSKTRENLWEPGKEVK